MRALIQIAATVMLLAGCRNVDATGTPGPRPGSPTSAPPPGTGAPLPIRSHEARMKVVVPNSRSALLRATHVLVVKFESATPTPWVDDPQGGVTRKLEAE